MKRSKSSLSPRFVFPLAFLVTWLTWGTHFICGCVCPRVAGQSCSQIQDCVWCCTVWSWMPRAIAAMTKQCCLCTAGQLLTQSHQHLFIPSPLSAKSPASYVASTPCLPCRHHFFRTLFPKTGVGAASIFSLVFLLLHVFHKAVNVS